MTREFMTRASVSGKLGEDFVERKFGVVENGEYEIKSTSRRNNQVVLKVIQLIHSGPKHFIIVRYDRGKRRITRGKRKGRYVPAEKINDAYQKKLDVFVVRGFDLLQLIAREHRPLMETQFERDADWAFYWTVRISSILPSLEVMFEDDEVIVYGNKLDPPRFLDREEEVEEVEAEGGEEVCPF